MSQAYLLSNWMGRGMNSRVPTATNLASSFNPGVPMVGPEYDPDPEKMVVMADIPPKLQALLDEGLDLIGVGCIKQNAQVVFGFFESFVIEYVISMQVQGRDLHNLM